MQLLCRVRFPRAGLAATLHQGRSTLSLSQQLMTFFIQVPYRFSDCVECMYVDPIRAVVQVAFNKGNVYEYTHVSRRAIANLLLQPSMSLGFWVNRNLLPYDCKSQVFGETTSLNCVFASAMPVT